MPTPKLEKWCRRGSRVSPTDLYLCTILSDLAGIPDGVLDRDKAYQQRGEGVWGEEEMASKGNMEPETNGSRETEEEINAACERRDALRQSVLLG